MGIWSGVLAYIDIGIVFYSLALASAAPDPTSEKRRVPRTWIV